jgi:hypothetical protein
MNIQERLEIAKNPVRDLIIYILFLLLFVWIGTVQIDELVDFIKAITNHGDVINITVRMGAFPAMLVLMLMFAMVIVIITLVLVAKYTNNSSLMRFDPDKIFITPFCHFCIKFLIIYFFIFFILPIFSDKIALKLGYRYFCHKPVETTYFESYLFYDFTYAKQPDLCPSFEDGRK